MKINERILCLRKINHLTQEQLGEKLSVSRQAVSKWESDTALPDLNNIIQMCNIFNVSADYLLFDKEPEKCETLPVHDKIPKPKFISAVFFSVFALLAVSVPFLAKFMQYTDFAATGECYTNYSQYILSFPLVVVPVIAFAFLCAAVYFK